MYRGMEQGSLCLRGNGYSQIIRDNGGRVRALWPMHPDRVTIDRPNQDLVYTIRGTSTGMSVPGRPIIRAADKTLPADQVLHVRGMSFDGVYGLSPIQLMAEPIGLGLAEEAYGAAFFGRGANPGGVIERPAGKTLSLVTVKALREQWAELYGGLNNAHRPAVLEDGMTWKPIGIPNDHAQFLESRNFQIGEIARAFGIPGVMIGFDDKTATYASAEQFFLSFVVHHVLPWAVKWEGAITLKFDAGRASYALRFTRN
jgi:HK97 family phage portal protein